MTISEERFTALEESVAKLHAALPALFAFRDNFELWAKETGVFDHLVQDVLSRVPKPSTAPVSLPAPSVASYPIGAYKLPIRPLTNGEQRNAIDAMVRAGWDGAPALELGFTKGFYPVVDQSVVTPVLVARWRDGISESDKAALNILLSAIDQRIPNPDGTFTPNLLPADDPRVVPISGTLGATSPVPAGVPATSTPVVYAESFVMVNPETGFTIWIGMSKNDDGLSVLYNYKYPWDNGASSNPKLPQMLVRMERNGGLSVNGTAPKLDAYDQPIPKGPWDGLAGKDFEIFPLGFDRGDSQGKSQHVDIACLQAGRILRLGASSETAKPTFPVEITATGASVNGKPL